MQNKWLIQDIWNETLIDKPFEINKRDYIRASDIGKSFLDRYYSMTGEPWTNVFDARVLRIFEAGNLYEWLVRLILVRAGILHSTQEEVKITGSDHLDVIGHLDFIGGGEPNWNMAKQIVPQLEQLYFPTRMLKIADGIIARLQEKFPAGLPKVLFDVKSINSMVFWRHMSKNEGNQPLMEAYDHHVLQLYTYMKGKGFNEGRLLYISKDDLTLAEAEVRADEGLEKRWRTDVQQMSYYYRQGIVPPREPDIVWDKNKYRINWKIQRSNYLEKIVGMKQEVWEDQIKKLEGRANYRVKEIVKKQGPTNSFEIRNKVDPYLEQELTAIYGDPSKVVIRKVDVHG